MQAEIVERVEKAGGAILAVDIGQVSHGSAGSWLSGTMLGAVGEYHRRVTAKRTQDAKRRAVERGVPPFPNVPPGYRLGDGHKLEPDPATATAVAEAFQLRATEATVMAVRAYLHEHGIERSFHGVQAMLARRALIRAVIDSADRIAIHSRMPSTSSNGRLVNARAPESASHRDHGAREAQPKSCNRSMRTGGSSS